jgi:hypothetical protein
MWRVRLLSVKKSNSLEEWFTGADGTPRLVQHRPGPGKTFLVVELGLTSKVAGTILALEELAIADDQGGSYSPVGLRTLGAAGADHVIGEFAGTFALTKLQPPSVILKAKIERTLGSEENVTTTETTGPLPDSGWLSVVLIWNVPIDASGLRLAYRGDLPVSLQDSTIRVE